MTQTILGILHGSVVRSSHRYVIRYILMHALRASRRSMQAGRWCGEILDRQPQRWRFCSSETLSLQAMDWNMFDPAAHEQWSLLDIVH